MPPGRILLLYIHEYSGHHKAAVALSKAFGERRAECRLVDALRYTHPILERLIRRTYLEIVRKRPEVWEYLYDNPVVIRHTRRLRESIHRNDSLKLRKLLDEFKPHAVVCTQAFPCGIVSEYKARFGYPVFLSGVLTDFFPHSYWVLDGVDRYFVPTEEAKEKLHENGVFEDRIEVAGIPIDGGCRPGPGGAEPALLVMGGSQGIGSMERIVAALDELGERFSIHVATGRNRRLHRKLTRLHHHFRKKVTSHPYLESTAALMRSATLLITKPGGLTIAEAMACRLPVIFINPLPGQESKNASFLLKRRAAVEAKNEKEAGLLVSQLLRTPAKIESMKKNAKRLARPEAASRIAEAVCNAALSIRH